MSSILVLSGSPSATSRTAALSDHLADRLRAHGHAVGAVRVRDLPAEPLAHGHAADPAIAEVVGAIAAADGLVVASPVYKAAYSGLLKLLLDLLPQFALAGKVVLPVVTGGTTAHVLAIDYALRPVLSSLGAGHIVPGWFVLDRHIEPAPDGLRLDPATATELYRVVDGFSAALGRPLVAASSTA
ncbi:NADPH-dependent FMN reductase [Amycolatopsis sp. YIM 10]|uniref:NADPH-dependent FMN reductase n=1 Tax=Amycolatopsis sp. YIM 10 TaxID=2653857 RepID=UPI001290797B|nr:NADPH-dependent FMN reductase [Amycolatopsis sp. YIM 10]QFU90595.1 FMN reductase (NADPH) [Amycolatopsis sp. YIM 10]